MCASPTDIFARKSARRTKVRGQVSELNGRVSLKADRTTAHDRTAGLWCGRAVGAR